MTNNNRFLNSAISGAISAIGSRWITSTNNNSYLSTIAAITAFATALDNAIPPELNGGSLSQARIVQSLSESFWRNRFPTSQVVSDYVTEAAAIATVYQNTKLNLVTEVEDFPLTTQPDWYLDPISGNDLNSGDSASTALKTSFELSQRIGKASADQVTLIHVLNDLPSTDLLSLECLILTNGLIRIIGENLTVLLTDTIDLATNLVTDVTRPSIKVSGIDWDTAGPGGTSLIGKRCRITASGSGTQIGTIFFLEEKDSVDAETAYISTPYFTAPPTLTVAEETIANGDTFVVEELRTIGQVAINSLDNGDTTVNIYKLWIENCRIIGDGSGFGNVLYSLNNGQAIAYGCDFDVGIVEMQLGALLQCRIRCFDIETFNNIIIVSGTFGNAFGNITLGRGRFDFFIEPSSTIRITVFHKAHLEVNRTPANFGLRINGFANAGILIKANAFTVLEGIVWGTSTVAASTGFRLETGAQLLYIPAFKPTVSGAAGDTRLGGVITAYAVLPLAVARADNLSFNESIN